MSLLDDIELTPDYKSKIQSIISDMDGIITGFMQSHDFESIKAMSQQEYNGLLMYVSMSYFVPTKCLYKYYPSISNDKCKTKMYDDILLCGVCDYYIYMSYLNNKMVNCHGFGLLTGIDENSFTRWEKDGKEQRPDAYRLVKRLRSEYEKSLINGAQSGKNPVGFIATLNHYYNWAADNKPTLTVNINRSQEQIMSTFDSSLIENKS